MGEIKIRTMVVADGAAVAQLSQELGYEVTVREAYERIGHMEGDPRAIAFVAIVDGQTVGWIQAHDHKLIQYRRVLEIGGLVVTAAVQGRGVGKALVEAVAHWGERRGHDEMFVRSNVTRDGAHQFYESIGFTRDKTSYTFSRSIS